LRVGVALGGGSARGYAHIGALASLERHDLAPQLIVGTSFGAIVGALYATGLSVPEIVEMASKVRTRDLPRVMDFGLHRAALFRGEKLEAYLDDLLEGRGFEDLKRELVVVATDLDTGERVSLRSGSLARALRASASLPGIFSPVEIEGRRLVDGGLGSPIPLETLTGFEVDLAIGIGVGTLCSESGAIRFAQRCLSTDFGRRLHDALRDAPGVHPLRQLGRSLAHTMTAWQTPQTLCESTLHVQTEPPISWLNFHKAALAITAGEEAMGSFIPKILEAVSALELGVSA